jgi:hypothetical protein
MTPLGFLMTFACVASAMVLFRSTTVPAAVIMLKGMIGLNGVNLPPVLYDRLGHLPVWLRRAAGNQELAQYGEAKMLTMWILVLGFVATALPNTLEVLARYEPALGIKAPPIRDGGGKILWRPSVAWAIAISLIATLGIVNLGGRSEFLYWQF